MDAAHITQHLAKYAPRYTLAQIIDNTPQQHTILAYDTLYHNTKELVKLRLLPRGPLIDHTVRRHVQHMRVLVGCAHVLCFRHAFLTPTHLGLVTEHAPLGSLYSRVLHNKAPLPPAEARWFFQQLVVAVHFLHTHSIAARDIKLDTCMLIPHPTPGRLPLLKLTDFQASKDVTAEAAHTRLGTLEYLPPEVLITTSTPNADPHRVVMDPKRADLYCMGVCLFIMLARSYPWTTREEQHKNPMALVPLMVSRMERGALARPDDIPDACWALLQGLLRVDPGRRMTIEDIRTNEWFRVGLPSRVDQILNPSCPTMDEPLPSNMQSSAELDALLTRAQGGPEPETDWRAWVDAQRSAPTAPAPPLQSTPTPSTTPAEALPASPVKQVGESASRIKGEHDVLRKGVKELVKCAMALESRLALEEGVEDLLTGLEDLQGKLLNVFDLVHQKL